MSFPTRIGVRIIKRVIGLPGERIEQRADGLYVNGQKLSEPYLNPALNVKSLQFGWNHVVPANTYFLMGDYRDNREDSRIYGPVPAELFFGRVRAISPHVDLQGHIHTERVRSLP